MIQLIHDRIQEEVRDEHDNAFSWRYLCGLCRRGYCGGQRYIAGRSRLGDAALDFQEPRHRSYGRCIHCAGRGEVRFFFQLSAHAAQRIASA